MMNTRANKPAIGETKSSAQELNAYPSPAFTPADANTLLSNPASLSGTPEHEEVEDDLTARIRASISYTTSCRRAGQTPTVYSDFTVPISDPLSTAITLLRTAEAAGISTFLTASHTHERYSLGVEPAQREQPFNYAVLSPQWWKNKTNAEIRAGPNADVEKMKDSKRYLKLREKSEKRGTRHKRFGAERHNIAVGLRQQGISEDEIKALENTEKRGKSVHGGMKKVVRG